MKLPGQKYEPTMDTHQTTNTQTRELASICPKGAMRGSGLRITVAKLMCCGL